MKNLTPVRSVKSRGTRSATHGSKPQIVEQRKPLVCTGVGVERVGRGEQVNGGCQTTAGKLCQKPSRACQEPTLAAGFRRRALFRGTRAPIKSASVPLAASDRRLKGCDTLSSSPYISGRKRRQRDLPTGLAVSRDQPWVTSADSRGVQGRTRAGVSVMKRRKRCLHVDPLRT